MLVLFHEKLISLKNIDIIWRNYSKFDTKTFLVFEQKKFHK